MKLEEVLPSLRDGASVQRESHPLPWAYLMRSENGAFHWYGFANDASLGAPMALRSEDLDATDWVIVDCKLAAARRPTPEFNCARRGKLGDDAGLSDFWITRREGDAIHKRCSFCGSLHPDEFMANARDGEQIVPTDKTYKAYIGSDQREKFYYMHLSEAQMHEFIALYNDQKLVLAEPGHFYVMPYFMQVQAPEEAAA